MALAAGTRLGPYEIAAQIGAGGMGEVYRATDTKLKRDVAVKVLPSHVAADPERLARFQREAEVLASLNHPNIAAIHGLEDAEGIKALVMELVEGPTLADRIAQGAIPVDEALPIAKQIAEALEAAHEQGIIHRDLKPANVKLRPDGVVKVLDFGLAKALEPTGAMSPGMSQAPTITTPAMTQAGMILGTAAYMSPEQAKGKVIDKRSDVWAFGAVLYEMLSGKRAFAGEDITETLADVMRVEPDWTLLSSELSASLATYLKRSLHKDPHQRIPDIAAMRLALEGAFETAVSQAAESGAVARPVWRQALPVAAMTAVVAVLVTGLVAWSLWPSAESSLVTRFDYVLPDGHIFRNNGRPVMAFSPDGRHFVYNTTEGLYLRAMGDLEARLIPGTEANSASPFISPNGQSVGFYDPTSNQLKRIGLTGGAPVVIAEVPVSIFGASWAPDETILFGQPEGILRVSANGGTPELVIPAEEGEQMDSPHLLPDGESVLFSVTTGNGATRWDQAQVVVQSLATGERTVVLPGGSDARYVPTGHLVYALEGGLFAVAFDADRLEVQGGPVSVIEGVRRALGTAVSTGAANYGVSDLGTLVYVDGDNAGPVRSLVWVDRAGREEPVSGPPGFLRAARLSPDGTRIGLAVRGEDGDEDIWIWDLALGAYTRLTLDPGRDTHPVWTPDSQRLVFASSRDGGRNIYWQVADGTEEAQRLTESSGNRFPLAISPDATRVVFEESSDLLVLRLDEGETSRWSRPRSLR